MIKLDDGRGPVQIGNQKEARVVSEFGLGCELLSGSGQRAYIATRILLQNGFRARTISGGMLSLAHNHLLGFGADEELAA